MLTFSNLLASGFFLLFAAALVIRIACQHGNVGRTQGQANENTSLIQMMLPIRTQLASFDSSFTVWSFDLWTCLRMPGNLGVPHFRSAEVLQARLEKGDLVRIGHVSPKANRNDLGVRCIPPAVAARCGPAPPRLFLRGVLATCPPRRRLSPLRACIIPSSLVSGYNEAQCTLRSLLLRPSQESQGLRRRQGTQRPLPGVRCQFRGVPAAPPRCVLVDRADARRQVVWRASSPASPGL